MRLLFLSILLVSQFVAFTQTTIVGTAIGLEGEVIKLLTYEDYITYKTKILGEARIDSLGNFQFELNNEEAQFCIIESKVTTGIYVEPKHNYQFSLPPLDTLLNYEDEPTYVVPDFIGNSSANINELISQFNIDYDDFVTKNLNSFILKQAKNKVDTFSMDQHTLYQRIPSVYFNDYMKYSMATLKMVSSYTSKKKIYKEYIEHSPVLYNNDSYMDFFNQFYKGHFKTMPLNIQKELENAIKLKMRWSEVDSILKTDEYLTNDTVRELVLIKNLMENYRNPAYSKKGVLLVLSEIEQQSLIEQHKLIAKNVYSKLSSVDVGSYAPEFELADLEGNIRTLTELSKYKYVYVDFWATWCAPCIKEMKLMPALYDEFGDYIEFVSISIDKKPKTVEKFIKKNGYKWTVLHIGDNVELLDEYKANVIPMFYLIAPGGKVLKSHADRPSLIRPEFEKIRDNYIKSRN